MKFNLILIFYVNDIIVIFIYIDLII